MSEDSLPELHGADRRAWVRYPCNLQTLYQPGQGRLDHRWWFAKVRDISSSGIGLIVSRHFPVGSQLSLALYSAEPEVARTLEVNVVHVAPHPGGGWGLGCAFASPLSDDELRAYWSEQRLNQVVEGSSSDAP